MCTFYMPLSNEHKFYLGKQTAEEYAMQYATDTGFWENMGVNVSLGKVGGVDWSKVWRGVKKSVGFSGKDEL